MEKIDNSLVSIGILTYNSSKTILETLDSAYHQTYKNIELIISDDGSKDDTVPICQKWVEEHKARFARCEILTVENNTGISANCNRLVSACKGHYIKYLAGDDIFMPTCVEDNVSNIGDADMLISGLVRFRGKQILQWRNPIDFRKFCSLSSVQRVHYYARTSFFCNVPTLFFRRSVYQKIGMYDENEPMLEDVPFLLKLFASDAKIAYFPKITIKYRDGGISNSNTTRFYRILMHAFWNYRIHYLDKSNLLDRMLICERSLFERLLGNREKVQGVLKVYLSRYNLFSKILNTLLFWNCRITKTGGQKMSISDKNQPRHVSLHIEA